MNDWSRICQQRRLVAKSQDRLTIRNTGPRFRLLTRQAVVLDDVKLSESDYPDVVKER